MHERRNLPVVRPRYDVVRHDGRRRHAEAIILAVAATGGTFVTAAGALTTAGVIAAAALNVAISLAVSMAISFGMKALAGKPRPEDVKRDLQAERSLPVKRFCYGEFYAPGSPAPWKLKADTDVLYGCLILNSRPSDGSNLALKIDKREVPLTGDAFNFAGPGATPSSGPLTGYLRVWVGLGDQVGPPADVLSEASTIFRATDA